MTSVIGTGHGSKERIWHQLQQQMTSVIGDDQLCGPVRLQWPKQLPNDINKLLPHYRHLDQWYSDFLQTKQPSVCLSTLSLNVPQHTQAQCTSAYSNHLTSVSPQTIHLSLPQPIHLSLSSDHSHQPLHRPFTSVCLRPFTSVSLQTIHLSLSSDHSPQSASDHSPQTLLRQFTSVYLQTIHFRPFSSVSLQTIHLSHSSDHSLLPTQSLSLPHTIHVSLS